MHSHYQDHETHLADMSLTVHERIEDLHRRAERLAPAVAQSALNSTCSDMTARSYAALGPRQQMAWDMVAEAHGWNAVSDNAEALNQADALERDGTPYRIEYGHAGFQVVLAEEPDPLETRTVDTSQLVIGDIVSEHGMLVRIDSVREYTADGGGTAWSCPGTVLNPDEVRGAGVVPMFFLDCSIHPGGRCWHIQGNTLARWTVVIPSEDGHCGLDNPHMPHSNLGTLCPGTTLDEDAAGEPEPDEVQDGAAPVWIRTCGHHGCRVTAPHSHGHAGAQLRDELQSTAEAADRILAGEAGEVLGIPFGPEDDGSAKARAQVAAAVEEIEGRAGRHEAAQVHVRTAGKAYDGQGRHTGHGPWLSLIHEANRISPEIFGQPECSTQPEGWTEEYPDARVVHHSDKTVSVTSVTAHGREVLAEAAGRLGIATSILVVDEATTIAPVPPGASSSAAEYIQLPPEAVKKFTLTREIADGIARREQAGRTIHNDTYGEITEAELAELRASAHKCTTCGMVADVDPALHASRYGHRPQYRDEVGTWAFATATLTWVQVAPAATTTDS